MWTAGCTALEEYRRSRENRRRYYVRRKNCYQAAMATFKESLRRRTRVHQGRQAAAPGGDRRDAIGGAAGLAHRGRFCAWLRGERVVRRRRAQGHARRDHRQAQPTSGSSSPRKPRSGPRWSSSRGRSRSDPKIRSANGNGAGAADDRMSIEVPPRTKVKLFVQVSKSW